MTLLAVAPKRLLAPVGLLCAIAALTSLEYSSSFHFSPGILSPHAQLL